MSKIGLSRQELGKIVDKKSFSNAAFLHAGFDLDKLLTYIGSVTSGILDAIEANNRKIEEDLKSRES